VASLSSMAIFAAIWIAVAPPDCENGRAWIA
jgi:hypothetical protein